MQGAARMVLDGHHPAIIRNAVATPGGCTIGGLLTMEDGKIRSTMVVPWFERLLIILGKDYPRGDKSRKRIRKNAAVIRP
jgi:Pyrroline-5-carboxylate reductase dimerisation